MSADTEAPAPQENLSVDFDEEKVFQDDNIPASNWFKFEKVGDKVAGIVAENPYVKAGQDEYPDQKVFELKQKDGSIVKVGIPTHKDYVIGRTNRVRRGDIVGFKFEKEVPPTKKGYAKAKSIQPYVQYTDAGNKERENEESFGEF